MKRFRAARLAQTGRQRRYTAFHTRAPRAHQNGLTRGATIETQAGLRISVVIPVLNDADFLEPCLAALERGRRPADEIVIVDNGSTDESAAVARAHGARVIWEPIKGIPRAASAGYDAATGDIIARLDADSIPGPDWLERIERAFTEREELSFVTGGSRFYGSNRLIHWIGENLYIGAMYTVLPPFFGHMPVFGSNMAMRADTWRELSDEVHREEALVHDDLDLTFHIKPEMTVLYDRDLIVGVSARPFASFAAIGRRIRWVFPTVALHWPAQTVRERRRLRRLAATERKGFTEDQRTQSRLQR